MAHQHAAIAEQIAQRAAVQARMPREHEIRQRVRAGKAQGFQLRGQVSTVFDDCPAVFLYGFLAPEHADAQRLGISVHIVGIDRIADGLQVADQLRRADAEADARAGQRPGLGKCLHYQQILIFQRQRDAGGAAEIHIGLVHHDHAVRAALREAGDLLRWEEDAGRRVGIRKHHQGFLPRVAVQADGQVVLHRDLLIRDAVDVSKHLVKAVGNVREQSGPRVAAEGHEGVIQHFIGAVADHDHVDGHLVALRQRLPQFHRFRIGIQLVAAGVRLRVIKRLFGRRERRFVGIQLQVLPVLRLLPRLIGLQRHIPFAQVLAHSCSSVRINALLACAVSPSLRANKATSSAASARASREK